MPEEVRCAHTTGGTHQHQNPQEVKDGLDGSKREVSPNLMTNYVDTDNLVAHKMCEVDDVMGINDKYELMEASDDILSMMFENKDKFGDKEAHDELDEMMNENCEDPEN